MRFWDSPALLTLSAGQPKAPVLQSVLDEDPKIAVWWGTRVEMASGACRLRREDRFDEAGFLDLLAGIDQTCREADEIDPSDSLREEAVRLVKVHDLRAGDAFQLAAALAWADHKPSGLEFVCLDKRLRAAAAKEGFAVLPE